MHVDRPAIVTPGVDIRSVDACTETLKPVPREGKRLVCLGGSQDVGDATPRTESPTRDGIAYLPRAVPNTLWP